MIQRLVQFSIRHPGVVVGLAVSAVAYGGFAVARAKYDVYPEFAPPQVVVQTEAQGLSPEQVETLVTRPIEQAVGGAGGLESLRSQSIQGLSVVTAVFREGTDIFRARQIVAERLSEAASRMPQGIPAPAVAPLTSATSMMFSVGLTSGTRSLMDLRTFADWTFKPRLLGVDGVAKVAVFGGERRQIQIQVLPERLALLGVGVDEVIEAARRSTGVRGAGFVEADGQRVVLRTEGQASSPDILGDVFVRTSPAPGVRLRDVSKVVDGPEPAVGDASIQGRRGVVLVVSSQYGANTLEVTRGVEKALDEMKPLLLAERIDLDATLFRPASFIERAISNVTESLLLGGVLVAVILFLFLWNFRSAAISLTAIPLSLLAAVVVLEALGSTLNTLTLGGLAIAIGEVVDDAIIDVENIHRRLKENREKGSPRPAWSVVLDASLEVRSAVVYATFVVALVFFPVLTMSGIQGRLFAPLGLAYVLAVVASLLVALTVTPALSLLLLAKGTHAAKTPRAVTALRERYGRLLGGVSRRPGLVVASAAALCLAALAAIPFFGGAFLPEFREGHFIVHMSGVPGLSLSESLRIGEGVTAELKKNPHLRSVSQRAGRAEKADDTWGPHYSEFNVDLVPLEGEEGEFVQSEIRDALSKFPGVHFAIKPFLTERIEETLSGVTAQVVVKLFGENLDALDGASREVARRLAAIDGAADVQVESPPGVPEMDVRLRPDRLRMFGVRPVDVLEAIQTGFQGTTVAQTYEGSRVVDVAVVLAPESRRSPESVADLPLRSASGGVLALRQVADVGLSTGRYSIPHDGGRRRQAITCNVTGRDVASFVAVAKRSLAGVALPPGAYVAFEGTAEAQSAAQREILLHSGIAAIGVLLLLSIVFRRGRNLLLVLANLPFALVGGVLAVFMTGGWLSVGSLVGFVTLFGITTRNSIMMVSHFEHLVSAEGATWGLETVIRGARERLVPVLMTAIVTGLGLLPLAIGSGEPGREIEGPMAIVILGGLATSTVLNLIVLPTLALRFGRFGGSANAVKGETA